MGNIQWAQSAVQIERLIRGLSPWPSAFTFLDKKTLKIWGAHVGEPETMAAPGTVISVDKKGIYVATGQGTLCLDEVQLEGKKRMAVSDFLRGYQIGVGTKFMTNKE